MRPPPKAARAEAPGGEGPYLSLLEGFELRLNGEAVELPLSAQRLVAFLALHNRPLQRGFVAGNLWLDSSEERAGANLRSALWRLHRHGRQLIDARAGRLSLASDVRVDVHQAAEQARRLIETNGSGHVEDPDGGFELTLTGELLPDWYEDWILGERERFRQLRVHALESLCDRLSAAGRHAQAIEAGLTAVASEPLRESAHRALIRSYLAEGNPAEAIRQYRAYERMLSDELGAQPSPQIRSLVATTGLGAAG
jgi:DNA-binding SARP family transcriptional activator